MPFRGKCTIVDWDIHSSRGKYSINIVEYKFMDSLLKAGLDPKFLRSSVVIRISECGVDVYVIYQRSRR